ncbi:hypothetical protein V7S43_011794 [Phytophthora oleae]|uniref:Bzip transcription factor n=1 Tax=Phytophthora oleae TaxID=2107226 RepID=A0ABD3FAT3_9STRA
MQHVSTTFVSRHENSKQKSPSTKPALQKKQSTETDLYPHSSYNDAKRMKTTSPENPTIPQKDVSRMLHLREQRRAAQQRYGKKKQDKIISLNQCVGMLQQNVEQLETLYHNMVRSTLESFQPDTGSSLMRLPWKQNTASPFGTRVTTSTCWGVAVEYFRLFRNGLKHSIGPPRAEEEFLRVVMAPDVAYDTIIGVEGILHKWRRVSMIHPDIDIQLVRLDRDTENTIEATVKGVTTVSLNTIQYTFPHLINGDAMSPLATSLLGRRLEADGRMRFTWDENAAKISSMQFQADMLTPMLRILGSLEDVSYVFKRAN